MCSSVIDIMCWAGFQALVSNSSASGRQRMERYGGAGDFPRPSKAFSHSGRVDWVIDLLEAVLEVVCLKR